ncbi:putative ribonuclease H protein [Vitis vinifera]|uniref:Putative ribonuclease H protein n=1 Tax=Vitis vinifera TaxID=29760 RepID=A0A438EAB2_VITVI|nr:putative ribonuclease H protein [Vitis vinifera]
MTFLSWTLCWFEAASGLRINLAKSEIIPVGEVDEILEMAVELGCKVGQLPSTYLGLPLGAPNKADYVWDGVKERMSCPFFRMPKRVARRLEKLQRDFLWGGGSTERKAHLVSWEKVCVSKEKGGLGLRKIVQLNKALLGKWVWRFARAKDEMWKRVLVAKYGQEEFGWRTKKANRAFVVGLWKEIMKEADWCWSNMTLKVGKGTKIRFWKDTWCGDVELARRFPLLFNVAAQKSATGIWVENVPSKLAFFAWEATWGRILTIDRLQKRGWQIPNRCYLCGSDEENANHLLIHCTVASVLWGMVLSLFGAQWVFSETVKEAQAEGLVSEIHLKEQELERLNGLWRRFQTSNTDVNTARNRFGRNKPHNIGGRTEIQQRLMLLSCCSHAELEVVKYFFLLDIAISFAPGCMKMFMYIMKCHWLFSQVYTCANSEARLLHQFK